MSHLNMQKKYRGWTYNYDGRRPVTGVWRAERHGVGMCAGNEASLKKMIDVRVTEEQEERARREKAAADFSS